MGGRGEPRIINNNVRQVSPLILAWSEYNRTLAEQQAELARLRAERDELKNRVALLDPRHVDPDMAGELLRKDLNVVHPDEMVILLD